MTSTTMNESGHTKGLLYINRDDRPDMEWNNHLSSVDEPHKTICFMAHDGTKENLEGEANARRLVACWNALLGVPTEQLEEAVGIPDITTGNLFSARLKLQQERNEAQRQALELREALKRLMKWVEPIAGDNRNPEAEREENESVEQAKTALAASEGVE